MKKIILLAGILITTVTFGSEKPSLNRQIEREVKPDLSEVELNEFYQDFVVVRFYIKDSKIQLIGIQGSKEQLIQLISKELTDMFIQEVHPQTDVYNYKFIFKSA